MASEAAGWSRRVSANPISYYKSNLFLGIGYEGAERDSTWDAIHVVKTNIDANMKVRYKVNSSVFLMMETKNAQQGTVDVAGNVTRLKEDLYQAKEKEDIQSLHLKMIGKLIEQNESEIRSEMYGIFINKSK